MNIEKLEIKSWFSNIEGYESKWTHIGDGTFILGGQSSDILPTGVYKIGVSNSGNILFCSSPVMSDELLVLPNSQAKDILKTVECFWNKKEDYSKFGQLHKRGILLHSSPGQGKSSILDLVFNEILKSNGLVFIVDEPDLAIEAVKRLRRLEPQRNLILLYEDIDSLFDKWGEKNLLSMLDGQEQTDNVLHIATTNYLERIPDRLKNRPGRFDEVIEIKCPDIEQRKVYIEHLLKNQNDNTMILQLITDTEGFSLAQIKELVLSVYLLEKNYQTSLSRIKQMGGN